MKHIILVSILVGMMCGCVAPNPYSHFYRDYTDGLGVANNPRLIATTNALTVRDGGDFYVDYDEMLRNGYDIIGESSFIAGPTDSTLVRQHARNVGAEVVLTYFQYSGTTTGAVPLTTPSMNTSHSQGSAFAYGSGGYATAVGSSRTTTYGSKTTYIPYTTHRYSYRATYWAKMKPMIFGVIVSNLNDEQRRQIESNKGAVVSIVVRNSFAFESDILEGDIIREINGTAILDAEHCGKVVLANRGKNAHIILFRNGNTVEKNVQFN